MGLHLGFTLDSLGRLVYSISRFLTELKTYTPTAFDPSITQTNLQNVQQPSTCISITATFSLLTNFALVLRTKFFKKINKKTTYKTFAKNFTFLFPCFTLSASLYNCRNKIYKNFLFYTFEYVLSV